MGTLKASRKLNWLFVVILLVAAGCGGGETRNAGTGDTGGTATKDEGTPKPGGSLSYGTYQEVQGFDPAVRGGTSHASVAIYDTLTKINDKGDAEPYLAASVASDDNITWTIKLRDGVKFHDGTPLDAAAVVFNLNRHKDPAVKSPFAPDLEPVASVEAVDGSTVKLVLQHPIAAFPTVFATGPGMIGSPTAVQAKGADFNRSPIGAGPFKFVSWVPDDRLIVEKNPDYWQKGLPNLDQLIFQPRPDTQTRFEAIKSGGNDITWMLTAAEITAGETDPNIAVYERAGNGAEGIILNVTRAPFDDLRMRQMMAHSLNYEVISNVRFAGKMVRACTPIGEDSPQYQNVNCPKYDLGRAKQLIADYKAGGGDPTFTFAAPNTPDRIAFGEMVQQFWKDLGLDVKLEFLDIAEYVQRVLIGRNFTAAINTMVNFAHPYPIMTRTFGTKGSNNYMGYSNPEMDKVLETARSAEGDAAIKAWQEVQTLIVKDVPWVFYARNATALMTRPHVKGVEFSPDGVLYPATLWRSA